MLVELNGLFASIPLLLSAKSFSAEEYEYEIEKIQFLAQDYLDQTCQLGLLSPYKHDLYHLTWPERFVRDLEDYASFRKGFHYLFWWSDESFGKNSRYNLKAIIADSKG